MTVTGSPAQPHHILPGKSDIDRRDMLTAEEIWEVVQYDCDQRGVRFRRDLAENVIRVYEIERKRRAMGGDGTTSTRQLARDLYPDVGDDMDAWRRKRNSVNRWLRLLVRQGVIEKTVLETDGGKCLGLRVASRAVCEVTALARGCSSAG